MERDKNYELDSSMLAIIELNNELRAKSRNIKILKTIIGVLVLILVLTNLW